MSEILLGVSGSAACFKAAALASALVQKGHGVTVVLTKAATKLVTPLQFSCLTSRRALCDEWKPQDRAGMDHIQLARQADVLIIAPATADRLGLLANGLAPDLLGSLCLAFEQSKARIVVPAMNPEMWKHPAVQRNVAQLAADGWQQIGPVTGRTACDEEGAGRMVEVHEVLAALSDL
ncbi:MAG: hypothetical protein H8E15_03975 [Planctomycetes bacterium]|nr:hypothetical protein [Planctomycetota bacterium]